MPAANSSPSIPNSSCDRALAFPKGKSWKENSSIGPRPSKSGSSNSETLFDYAGKQDASRRDRRADGRPDFWNNQEQAQATVAELKESRALVKPLDEAISAAADIQAMIEMADEDEGVRRRIAARARARRGADCRAGAQGPAQRPATTPTGPSSRSTPATAAPTPTIGPRCCCGCIIHWAAEARLYRRAARPPGQRRGRHQQRHASPFAGRWPTAI